MTTAILVGDDITRIWAAAPGPSEETLAIMAAPILPVPDLPALETPVTDAVLDRLATLGKPALDAAVERALVVSPSAHAKAWLLRELALSPEFRAVTFNLTQGTR